MNLKRIMYVLLTMLLCISCFGCGNKEEKKETGKVTVSKPGEFPIVDSGEEVELTVWAILSSSIDEYDTNYQSEWYEEYSGVKIHWVNVPAQGWADAFQKSVMDGDYPDIYLYDFSTSEVDICAEYGAIIPLNDLIEEHCPNIKQWFEEDESLKEAITTPDGNIYTLFSKTYNQSAYTQKLWVNKDWLAQYTDATGNGMPETTEEFKAMLLYFKENDMNGNGDKTDEIPYMGTDGLDGLYNLFDAFIPCNSSVEGYGCYVKDGELQFSYNTDEFRNALKYVHELFELGLISDQSFTISSSDRYFYTSPSSSETTVGVASAVKASGLVQLSNEENSLDYSDYVAIPPLEGPNGTRSYVTNGTNIIGLRNAITTKCEYPEVAIKWLDYWYSEEGRLWSVNGGLENEHWEYVEGETISGKGEVVSSLVDDKTNFSWTGQGVNNMIFESDFEHMDISILGRNDSLATYMADKEYSKYAIDSGWPKIVWVTDENSEGASKYSELVKLIKDHVTQSYTDFTMGELDINNDTVWSDYVNKLEDMGLEEYKSLVKLYMKGN